MIKIATAALLLLGLVLTSHQAQASVSASTKGYSETQVEGITSTVVDDLWSRTDYWWHRGDYPRIIADDRIITEADQHFLIPYSVGGWLMESMGNNSDAEKYYRLGAVRNPDKSYAWFTLAIFYFNTLKDYPKAIQSFTLAVNDSDSTINDWKMLAHSYEHNNQLPQAIAVWQKLQQKYPTDGVIAHNLIRDQNLLISAATVPSVQSQ